MGYLSQRKKSERESIFLKASSIIFVLLTAISFIPAQRGLFPNVLFHFYFLNGLLFLYSLYIGRFNYSSLFLALLIINFFHVSAYANIFFDTGIEGGHTLKLNYAPEKQKNLPDPDILLLSSGYLELEPLAEARFWTAEKNGHAFNIIRINFSKLSDAARKKAFRRLAAYIDTQDDPVIIYGNFGEAAWSANMAAFLKDTGLKVKNRLIFAGEGSRFNPFALPKFYVLGFSNLGVKHIEVNAPHRRNYPEISLLLGFE